MARQYTCNACTKKYVEDRTRDNGNNVCPDCYEKAGIENEHFDGMHKSGPVDNCDHCANERPVTATGQFVPSVQMIEDVLELTAQNAGASNETYRTALMLAICGMPQTQGIEKTGRHGLRVKLANGQTAYVTFTLD